MRKHVGEARKTGDSVQMLRKIHKIGSFKLEALLNMLFPLVILLVGLLVGFLWGFFWTD